MKRRRFRGGLVHFGKPVLCRPYTGRYRYAYLLVNTPSWAALHRTSITLLVCSSTVLVVALAVKISIFS